VAAGTRRRRDCANTSFTFLGYTFRARQAPAWDGTGWEQHLHTGTELEDLAAWINPVVRG
jgi:RNA-directed DNA polymerase